MKRLISIINDFAIDVIKEATVEAGLDDFTILALIDSTRSEVFKAFSEIPEEAITQSESMKNVVFNVTKLVGGKNVERRLLQSEFETSLLTGLPNQRVGTRTIKTLIESGWTFFDLDRLKSINLAFGKHVTDRLIRNIGDTLKKISEQMNRTALMIWWFTEVGMNFGLC